jgi:hypothetical protein
MRNLFTVAIVVLALGVGYIAIRGVHNVSTGGTPLTPSSSCVIGQGSANLRVRVTGPGADSWCRSEMNNYGYNETGGILGSDSQICSYRLKSLHFDVYDSGVFSTTLGNKFCSWLRRKGAY